MTVGAPRIVTNKGRVFRATIDGYVYAGGGTGRVWLVRRRKHAVGRYYWVAAPQGGPVAMTFTAPTLDEVAERTSWIRPSSATS